MNALDHTFIRHQFPAFQEPSLDNFAYFENAGGTYACGPVVERLAEHYRRLKLQAYYPSRPSQEAGERMDSGRARLAAWLNVTPEELQLGPSTSQNTYVLAQAFRQSLKPGDEIIVTDQDHEANIGAWQRLSAAGLTLKTWQVDPGSGELDPATLAPLLTERTRVVAFTHCSNLIATVNPVRQIIEMAHAAGALAVVDGVGHAPHALPDLAALGADIYLFSLYKVYGPHLGAMYVRGSLLESLPNQGHFFNEGKPNTRLVPAGPDHAQVAAVNGVIDYLESVARHHGLDGQPPPVMARGVSELFQAQEARLMAPLLEFLRHRRGVRLLGRPHTEGRAPTLAFTCAGIAPWALAQRLAAENIGIGAGNFYAWRLLEALGIDPNIGVARLSLVHYTSEQEVARVISALDRLLPAAS